MNGKAVFILSLMSAALHFSAAEWFVDNRTGSDANGGDRADAARKSFSAVTKLLKPGDTLHIANTGIPYAESLVLRGNFGLNGKPLTVEGNGAAITGLVPLDPEKWTARDNGFFYPTGKQPSNWRLYLYSSGKRLPVSADPAACVPGSFAWCGDGFFLRPEEGRKPADYRLEANLRDSGVQILQGKNITVRNLISEHNGNDGFNMHGSCHGLRFENIVGRWNGDDGFSIHEDGEAYVAGAEFHDNSYGIEDINLSRTTYSGVRIYNNRTGVHFSGGNHALIGCSFYDNATSLKIGPGRAAVYLPEARDASAFWGECFIKNTRIAGGKDGLTVNGRSTVTLINSLIQSGGTTVSLAPGSELYMAGSILVGGCPIEMDKATLSGDRNLFYPDQMKVGSKIVSLPEFGKLTGSNALSVSEKPKTEGRSIEPQPFLGKSPRMQLGPEF